MTEMHGGRPLRVAYINQDFPPEVGAGPARVLELSRFWQEAGAEVTVITGMPNRRIPDQSDGAVPEHYRGRWFMRETWAGIPVMRSWLYSSPNRSVAHTLVNNASFMVSSTVHAWARARTLDLIIASSPPFLAHVTGANMRLVQRAPLVLEIRDLWPDYMVEMGLLKNRFARGMLFGLERQLLRRARQAVVVTEAFRDRVVQKGLPRECIEVIPNGVDLDAYYRDPRAQAPLSALAPGSGKFTVGYLGNFGAGQDLRTVVEAAALLQERAPWIRFVLAGDGTQKTVVEQYAAAHGTTNLEIYPPIAKDRTRDFYNSCDLCLVPLAPLPIFAETVPSKLFEVMACERPLLASVTGEAARIVGESAAGTVAPPGDSAAMACGILQWAERPEAERAHMAALGRAYVAAHYSRKVLAGRYMEVLRHVAANPRSPCYSAGGAARE